MLEKHFGADNPDVAVCLDYMAAVYTEQGRFSEAEPFATRSLGIIEKVAGPEDPQVVPRLDALARIYTFRVSLPTQSSY